MAKFEATDIKESARFDDGLNFKKIKKICMEKVALLECKTLLSSNHFHTCTLNFPKIQTEVQTYSLMLGTSNWYFRHALSISDIL